MDNAVRIAAALDAAHAESTRILYARPHLAGLGTLVRRPRYPCAPG